MSQTKLNVAILYGGKNTEYEISLISAHNIAKRLDDNLFKLILIAISPEGRWYLQDVENITDSLPTQFTTERLIEIKMDMSPQPFKTAAGIAPAIDVVFPVLHGINGEDGTIQGLLRCLNLPFVGCDVLSTAICMDKIAMKQCFASSGVKTAPWEYIQVGSETSYDTKEIISTLGLPLFIKPANAGSSVGVIKVNTAEELTPAIQEASQYDQKILIEAMITGREIECSVLGNSSPQVSLPGEIITDQKYDFYSYEAKYLDDSGARLSYPAELTEQQVKKIQTTVINAFSALHCEGMARVDCFLTADDTVYVNEINTIPGFTPISMYPKLWEISGVTQSDLISTLINLAREKFDKQQSLRLKK